MININVYVVIVTDYTLSDSGDRRAVGVFRSQNDAQKYAEENFNCMYDVEIALFPLL